MSEEDKKDQTQPLETEPLTSSMMRKTSSVPLRKETVRVTLKSVPTGALGETQPVADKAAPTPPAPSVPQPKAMSQDDTPPSGEPRTGRNPNVPDVTSAVPLKQETMRVTLKADPTSQTDVKPAEPGKPVAKKPMVGKKPSSPVAPMTPPSEKDEKPVAKPNSPNIPDVTYAVPLKKETMAVTLKADPTAQVTEKASPADVNSKIPDVTTAVPLKKETMKVTLKADPTAQVPTKPAAAPPGGAPKAPAAPIAGAPKAPTTGGAPAAPVAGAPKAPAAGGAPSAPKLAAPAAGAAPKLGAAPKMASPAPTIALNTPKAGQAPTVPLATPAASQPLPQATVQLEKTQQLNKPDAPSIGASFEVSDSAEEQDAVDTGKTTLILVAACLALSFVVLGAQLMQAKVWIDEYKGGDMGALFSD